LEIANQIRDEIIPYAIEYYLNLVGGEDFDDFEEDEEEEDEPEEVKKASLGGKGKGKLNKH